MNINDWVVRTRLESPITEHALLLLGRNGVTNDPIGSAVFIAAGLAITAKHVIEEFWRLYGTEGIRLDQVGDKIADFEIMAIQYPGEQSNAAVWITRMVWLCPYSDIAAISLEPVDELSKGHQFSKLPMLSVLPPKIGEKVTAFGYAASEVLGEEDNQIKLALNPLTVACPHLPHANNTQLAAAVAVGKWETPRAFSKQAKPASFPPLACAANSVGVM